jgi:DNA repair exonuclease SbcCD nuclease subunit
VRGHEDQSQYLESISSDGGREVIRFLHAADLHLGLRITRFEETACNRIGEARFHALEQLRDKASEHRVDFILIAGDVFDDHTVSRTDAARAFAKLESSQKSCPVFLIPGNHDPLIPGGVWDRDPWLRDQPHLRVHLLRDAKPVDIEGLPVTIFPCPLRQRRSMDDPTAWMERHPRANGDPIVRIGLAHGSLNIMPNLPEDDHLIRKDAADHYGLDYLALGHWHKHSAHKSADGIERTAYSGTHEPMRFSGAGTGISTGWSSFSADGDAERFRDDGHGTALLVTIEAAGASPRVEPIEIGRLRWSAEQRDMTGQPPKDLISDYSRRENPERTILRLVLSGVVDPRVHARLDELKPIIQDRYHAGSSLDVDAVLIEPNAEQLGEVVGVGVLNRVLEKLKEEAQSTDAAIKRVADHALKLLYRIAWEEQPK